MLETLPWIGYPYDRNYLNGLATRLKVSGLPSLLIMNRDDTISGDNKGRKGRGA